MNSLKFVDTNQFSLALKEAEKGAIVIGESPKVTDESGNVHDKGYKPVVLHYYNGEYYTDYGMKVDTNNSIFYEMHWNVFSTVEETAIPAIDLMHKMTDTMKTKMVDYKDCVKEVLKKKFNQNFFDYTVNKQSVIINTTSNHYMVNVVRLLYTVKEALELDIYDHIYVFIKDEWLYKDTAKSHSLADIFKVSEKSKITFVIVREGANCIGFFGDIFDVKEGNRILRIYDQRVTETVTEDDIISHYYHAQQDRDDCIYFNSIYEGYYESDRDCEYMTYWIDITEKDTDLTYYYYKTLLNLMEDICNGISKNDNKIETTINYSVLSEI